MTGQKDPVLNFRSLTGKAKNAQGDLVTVAGDQLLCKDITKNSVRSPFEKDVLQNLESAETLLDYTLSRLGINSDRLQVRVCLFMCAHVFEGKSFLCHCHGSGSGCNASLSHFSHLHPPCMCKCAVKMRFA